MRNHRCVKTFVVLPEHSSVAPILVPPPADCFVQIENTEGSLLFKSSLLAGSLLFTLASPSFASVVCDESYAYDYGDTTRQAEADAYTVTENCQPGELHRAPKPFVALRVMVPSGDVQENIQDVELVPNQQTVESDSFLGTVRFRFDSALLSADEKRKLNAIISKLPGNAKLRVTGYTCSIGTKGHNMKLSKRRAKAVADFLRANEIDVVRIEAKGECCPVSVSTKKLNRRVEINKEGGK